MVKGKVAGIMIGGLAGYLLLNRVMSVIENSVKNVCHATEWKAYYKYGKLGDNDASVPPGYRAVTRKVDPEHEYCIEDPTKIDENGNDIDRSKIDKTAQISDSIKKTIRSCFGDEEGLEGAKKSEETVSEEDICPETEEGSDTDGDNVVSFMKDVGDDPFKTYNCFGQNAKEENADENLD